MVCFILFHRHFYIINDTKIEAITEHSKQVYEHLGFRTVATLRMGPGKASPDGELQDGGEGIPIYAMILE